MTPCTECGVIRKKDIVMENLSKRAKLLKELGIDLSIFELDIYKMDKRNTHVITLTREEYKKIKPYIIKSEIDFLVWKWRKGISITCDTYSQKDDDKINKLFKEILERM